MGPDEAWLEPDGFLEHLGAFAEPVLLKADGAEHRAGRGSRLGIGERPAAPAGRLPGAALPGPGRPLSAGPRAPGAPKRPQARRTPQTKREDGGGRDSPLQETRRPPGSSHVALGPHGGTATLLSVVEPQAKLDRSRLVALRVDRAERGGAEVRVRVAEQRPVEDVADTEAWNLIRRSPFSGMFLARVTSSLNTLNPRTVPSALGALPNVRGPGSVQPARLK